MYSWAEKGIGIYQPLPIKDLEVLCLLNRMYYYAFVENTEFENQYLSSSGNRAEQGEKGRKVSENPTLRFKPHKC
jgi:hypothetical protein